MIDIVIRDRGMLLGTVVIDYQKTVLHTTNRYWYEYSNPHGGALTQSGELEHDTLEGEVALIKKVIGRLV